MIYRLNRGLVRFSLATMMASGCLALSHRGDGAEPDLLREIEVVVSTNVSVTEEHTQSYLDSLQAEVGRALDSLDPLFQSPEKIKDGAARYRLVLQHKGTVSLANTLTVQSGFPKTDIKTFQNSREYRIEVGKDLTYHQTQWFLAAKHKGTLAFKLFKWEKESYKTVDSWTMPVPEPIDFSENKGLLLVADLVQDGKKGAIDPKPKCPKTLAEAKTECLKKLMPGPFEKELANRWVKGKLLAAVGKNAQVEIECQIKNNSPWPVKRVAIEAFTSGTTLLGSIEFEKPIPSGKSVKCKTTADPISDSTKKTKGILMTDVTFAANE